MKASTTRFDALRTALRGTLLCEGDPHYDDARTVWNAMIDKRPVAIVRCAGVADVMASVNFARDAGLPLAVRGGGHNVAGNAVCEGGVVVDLSPMRSVHVDPTRRRARVEGGCTWRDLDIETAAFGLATTGGIIPSTGVGGLTLGGGLGWLMGTHGLSCDNVRSVDVVTADGTLVTASDEQNPDLYWGLRGGGGNFGVATSFEFALHPVERVIGGMVLYPLSGARTVLRFWREYIATAPDALATQPAFLTTPDGVRVLAIIVCWGGSIAEGERVLAPLRTVGTPLADLIEVIPYVRMQALLETGFPPGMRNYWKSNFLSEFGDAAIDVLIDAFARVPSNTTAVAIEDVRGAVHRVDADSMAFPHRGEHFNLLIVGIWRDRDDDAAHIRWVRELWNAMQPFSSSRVYVNYLGEEGRDRIKEAYGEAKYARLVQLKRKYDPENLFRSNQNIAP
ncbi:MAG TPA: FAD-binding oxidoreductase [Pseudomonadales bacterium]